MIISSFIRCYLLYLFENWYLNIFSFLLDIKITMTVVSLEGQSCIADKLHTQLIVLFLYSTYYIMFFFSFTPLSERSAFLIYWSFNIIIFYYIIYILFSYNIYERHTASIVCYYYYIYFLFFNDNVSTCHDITFFIFYKKKSNFWLKW